MGEPLHSAAAGGKARGCHVRGAPLPCAPMNLLQDAARRRAECDERERLAVRARLRAALSEFLPAGSRVWLYGSLAAPGRFREWSDIDLALAGEPRGMSVYLLMSLLAERAGRPVDLVLLGETRLRETILREGEPWTL